MGYFRDLSRNLWQARMSLRQDPEAGAYQLYPESWTVMTEVFYLREITYFLVGLIVFL